MTSLQQALDAPLSEDGEPLGAAEVAQMRRELDRLGPHLTSLSDMVADHGDARAIQQETITLKPGRWRLLTMPIEELETVRVITMLHAWVVLTSDRRLICCELQDEAQARWLGAAIERHIATLPPGSQGIYR